MSPHTILPDPLPHDYLIGRGGTLDLCRKRLKKGGCVALFGAPGIGKSALALTVAHDPTLRRRFFDLVLYVALGPEPDLVALLGSWGARLRIVSADAANAFDANGWTQALRQAIGERRALVIVDDVWRVEHFHPFSVGGPNCAYLVTTRFPGLASDIAGPDAIELSELSPEESLTLLTRLAPRAVDYDGQAIERLTAAVGGLPIALHLLGNHLRKEAMSGQPRRIAAALAALANAETRLQLPQSAGLLKGRPTVSPNTVISLQALIEVSVKRLMAEPAGAQAIQALHRLAAFPPKPSSFSEDAAEAVCDVPRQALDALYDFGLLESTANGRYTLHQIMRDYALVQVDANDLAEAQQRMLSYFAALIERHATDIDLLTLESNAIHSALRVASQRPLDRVFVRAVNAFAPFMELRGEYDELARLLTLAEGVAVGFHDADATAEARLYLGRLAEIRGAYDEASRLYGSAMDALTSSASTERLRITLLARLAELALRRGANAVAEIMAHEGLERAQAAQSQANEAFLRRIIAQAAGDRGDMVVGDTEYREALNIAKAVGDVDTAISCLQNMGAIAFKRGHYKVAIALLTQGLNEAKAIGHVRRVAALHNALGCVYVKLVSVSIADKRRSESYRAKAEERLNDCLQLATAYHLPLWQNHALQNLGALERECKQYDQAREHLLRAQEIAQAVGDRWIIAETACELGELYVATGEYDESLAAFKRAIAIADDNGDEELELLARAYYGLSRLWAAKGNVTRARYYGKKSLRLFERMQFGEADEVRQWLASV